MRGDRKVQLPSRLITGLDKTGFEILKILLMACLNHSPVLRPYTHYKKQRLCPALSAQGGSEKPCRGHKKLVDFCYHYPWEEILGGLTGKGWGHGYR